MEEEEEEYSIKCTIFKILIFALFIYLIIEIFYSEFLRLLSGNV